MNTLTFRKQGFVPSKIVCVGRNYAEHIAELNNETPTQTVIFMKPNSAVSTRLVSGIEEPIHFEAEICFMIKNQNLHAVGFGLDLTKRASQSQLKEKGLPWERAKAFDASATFSEFVALPSDLRNLTLALFINDKLQQEGGYSLMLNKPEALLAEVQSFMSLEDGDILMTGTPKGVGMVNKSDKFLGRILNGHDCLVEQSWVAQ